MIYFDKWNILTATESIIAFYVHDFLQSHTLWVCEPWKPGESRHTMKSYSLIHETNLGYMLCCFIHDYNISPSDSQPNTVRGSYCSVMSIWFVVKVLFCKKLWYQHQQFLFHFYYCISVWIQPNQILSLLQVNAVKRSHSARLTIHTLQKCMQVMKQITTKRMNMIAANIYHLVMRVIITNKLVVWRQERCGNQEHMWRQ